jgi:uncharacterized integral membrane protein
MSGCCKKERDDWMFSSQSKKISESGSRTPAASVKARNPNRWTNSDLVELLLIILFLFSKQNLNRIYVAYTFYCFFPISWPCGSIIFGNLLSSFGYCIDAIMICIHVSCAYSCSLSS